MHIADIYNTAFVDELMKVAKFKGTLLPHQVEALEKFNKEDAILLLHHLGSGKTITSIAGTEDGGSVDVVVPASLRENYKKELAKFTTPGGTKRNVISYNKYVKEGPTPGAKAAVFDEPQRIGRHGTLTSQTVVGSALLYPKRMLLTGTPATNYPYELAPIIRTLTPEAKNIPLDPIAFKSKFLGEKKIRLSPLKYLMGMKPGVEFYPRNVEEIKGAIKGKVHYYKPDEEGYPERIDEVKSVEASPEQVKYYKYVTKRANPVVALKVRMNMPLSKKESKELNAFMTAARQVSNTTKPYGGKEQLSPKLKTVIDDFEESVNKNKKHKGIIYSNYLGAGVDIIAEEMEKRGIPYTRFTGKLNDKQKKESVDKYNKGEVKAILVSGAGSEGLDLKNTRSIQIIEPHWNQSRIEQVVGRGIRYKSHEGLPKSERKVDVIKYQTTIPKKIMQKIFKKKSDTSADQYLETLSKDKQRLLDKFLDIFKEEGVQKSAFDMMCEKKYQAVFKDELEKIAAVNPENYLYHYFSPKSINKMVSSGGIVATPRKAFGGKKVTGISTTRDPKATFFKSLPTKGDVGFLRFKLSKDIINKNYKIKPFDDIGLRSIGKSEAEELIILKKIKGKQSVVPFSKIKSIEVADPSGLKNYLRSGSIDVNKIPQIDFSKMEISGENMENIMGALKPKGSSKQRIKNIRKIFNVMKKLKK